MHLFILFNKVSFKKVLKSFVAMKCSVCGKTLAETFLKKIVGAYVKDEKGKRKPVCRECQKNLRSKEEILKQIK